MAVQDIKIPDIGDFKDVPILEILVSSGDIVEKEQVLLIVESDKAIMDIPSSHAGVVKEMKMKVGDKVSEGMVILTMAVSAVSEERASEKSPVSQSKPAQQSNAFSPIDAAEPTGSILIEESKLSSPPPVPPIEPTPFHKPHAGPAVRQMARELGVVLAKVKGSGRKGRILKEDMQTFVKEVMTEATHMAIPFTGGSMGIPEIPEIDFSQFGEIETCPLSRIKKISGVHLQRSWLNIPHVTQFDEVDITELETFRKDLVDEAKKRHVKMTLLAFLLKGCAAALREFPDFNASLDVTKENLILKKYCHIGVAVETKAGLVVPVIRDVNKKGLFELANNLGEISEKARNGKLSPTEMQGGCFTISSLGGIGGTAFTPIINAPEVAILGVSRSQMQPVYQEDEFVPRLMLPLSLSYDHRVIDGAAAVRFTRYLSFILSDVRRLLL